MDSHLEVRNELNPLSPSFFLTTLFITVAESELMQMQLGGWIEVLQEFSKEIDFIPMLGSPLVK